MVFESLVADLLNRFIGSYVVNLDASQLRIGLWQGDVVLRDLVIKESALEDLDLPIQAVGGCVGKLVLKIPWHNLYEAPVIALVEDLQILAVPKLAIKYDPDKERRASLDHKQRFLAAMDEQRARANAKNSPEDQSFFEKLTIQVLKNIQIRISNVHIRYEDGISHPALQPFAIGVTLTKLSLASADAQWHITEPTQGDKNLSEHQFLHKMATLEGFGLYISPNCTEFVKLSNADRKQRMHDFTANGNQAFIVGPLSSEAKLRIFPRPDPDALPLVPKFYMNLAFKEIALGLEAQQYRDVFYWGDNFGRLVRGQPYRKYRPDLYEYKGHYSRWWKFAYDSILAEDVHRRRRNFSWSHIKQHRAFCDQYAKKYAAKLRSKKVSPTLQAELDQLESVLDLFNLSLIRNRVQMEVEKDAKDKRASEGGGWLSWVWGGGQSSSEPAAIMEKFQEAMTPEEKAKLYKAIGYVEGAGIQHFPPSYVEKRLEVSLDALSFSLREEKEVILTAAVEKVGSRAEHRPGANAFKVALTMNAFPIYGCPASPESERPLLVKHDTMIKTGRDELLELEFQKNPSDIPAAHSLRVRSLPLEVMVDARTLCRVAKVFRSPKEVNIEHLQAAAFSRLQKLKTFSAAGLEYVIRQHKAISVDVELSAPRLLVPEAGNYEPGVSLLLVLNLGNFSMKSSRTQPSISSVATGVQSGLTDEQILQRLFKDAYETYDIKLTEVQALVAAPNEDWKTSIGRKSTPLHILSPNNLELTLKRCLVADDPRLPRIRVEAPLKTLSLETRESKVKQLIRILIRVAEALMPESPPDPLEMKPPVWEKAALNAPLEFPMEVTPELPLSKPEDQEITELEIKVTMDELYVGFLRDMESAPSTNLPSFATRLTGFAVEVNYTTRILAVDVSLDQILLEALEPTDPKTVRLVETPQPNPEDGSGVLRCRFVIVSPDHPLFETKFHSIEKLLRVNFSAASIALHQEIILNLIASLQNIVQELSDAPAEPEAIEGRDGSEAKADGVVEKPSSSSMPKMGKCKDGQVLVKVEASLGKLGVSIWRKSQNLAEMRMLGLTCELSICPGKQRLEAEMKDFSLVDPRPNALYRQLVAIVGRNAFQLSVQLYDESATEGKFYLDMNRVDAEVTASFGGAKCIFLYAYVSELLAFVDQFQSAKQSMWEASLNAAEMTRVNIQRAVQKAFRVRLNIDMKAPLIFIPRNSDSEEIILADFGALKINNTFQMSEIRNELGEPVIFDKIHMELNDMKLSRTVLSRQTLSSSSEVMILDPVSFQLNIDRNLTMSWYKDAPQMAVTASLPNLKMTISKEDYQGILLTLQENLSESHSPPNRGAAMIEATPSRTLSTAPIGQRGTPSPLPTDPSRSKSIPPLDTLTEAVRDQTEREKLDILTEKFMTFSFNLDKAELMLYSGASDLGPKLSAGGAGKVQFEYMYVAENYVGGIVARNPSNALARMTLEGIKLRGILLTDNTNNMEVVLGNLSMSDLSEPPNRLVSRRRAPALGSAAPSTSRGGGSSEEKDPGADEESLLGQKSMFEMELKTDRDGTRHGRAKVFGFSVIVDPPFLLAILDFFVPPSPRTLPSISDTQATRGGAPPFPDAPPAKKTSSLSVMKPRSQSSKPRVSHLPESQQTEQVMVILFQVEESEATLLESLKEPECRATVMSMSVRAMYSAVGTDQNVNGVVSALHLYYCRLSRQGTLPLGSRIEILRPTDLSFTMGLTPTSVKYDLNFGDLVIHVSPAMLSMFSNISNNIMSSADGDAAPSDDQTQRSMGTEDTWKPSKIKPNTHWFLEPEEAEDALDTIPQGDMVRQQFLLEAKTIVVTLEVGSAGSMLPVILIEAGIQAEGYDWSSQLRLGSTLFLEVAYYSPGHALWEPLLEPVEVEHAGIGSHRPWELIFEVYENSGVQKLSSVAAKDDGDDYTSFGFNPPRYNILLSCEDTLNLTLTRTSIDVLLDLTETFQKAIASEPLSHGVEGISAPFVLKNLIGLPITIHLDNSVFQSVEKRTTKEIEVPTRSAVGLELVDASHRRGYYRDQDARAGRFLTISLNEGSSKDEKGRYSIPTQRCEKRFFHFQTATKKFPIHAGFLMETTYVNGCKLIILSSCVSIDNRLTSPVSVHTVNADGRSMTLAAEVQPGEVVPLPLSAVYTPSAEFYFKTPVHKLSTTPYVWRYTITGGATSLPRIKVMHFLPEPGKTKLDKFISVMGTIEWVCFERSEQSHFPSHRICLNPLLTFKNTLPFPIMVMLDKEASIPQEIAPGHHMEIDGVELRDEKENPFFFVIRILDYMGTTYSCKHPVPKSPDLVSTWEFRDENGSQPPLHLGVYGVRLNGGIQLDLFASFWVVNQTGLPLYYKADDGKDSPTLIHDPKNPSPILLSFKRIAQKKKMMKVKTSDSSWSAAFPINLAGSSGVIKCQGKNMTYQFGISLSLLSVSHGKLITFTPFFYLTNNAPFPIEYRERDNRTWVTATTTVPFWPSKETKELVLRVKGTSGGDNETVPFPFHKSYGGVLRLDNRYGGLMFDVKLLEHACYVTVDDFSPGQETALIVNDTPYDMEYKQKGSSVCHRLRPNEQVVYAWESYTRERSLIWSMGSASKTDSLTKDGAGEFTPRDGEKFYWVSFLSAFQRVLLLTPNLNLVTRAQLSYEMERMEQSYQLAFSSVGLSLVDNVEAQEVVYFSITGSDVLWESRKDLKRFRAIKPETTTALERAYQRYITVAKMDPNAAVPIQAVADLKVDLSTLTQLEPERLKLRRSVRRGIWAHLSSSPHQIRFHLKINTVQIDSQLPHAIYPIAFAPVPPPKSVMAEGPRPFVEMSLVMHRGLNNTFRHFQYVRILVQECHLKIDRYLFDALLPFLTPFKSGYSFESDMEMASSNLHETALLSSARSERMFFTILHLSPLKIHLTFALSGIGALGSSGDQASPTGKKGPSRATSPTGGQQQAAQQQQLTGIEKGATFFSDILNFIMQSGIMLTDVQDIIFRLGYFEVRHRFMTAAQLRQEATSHYVGAALKQLFVLVLGLDVIGNPFGFVVDLTQGIEDFFYEPVQGAIQGPEEFAEGVVLGLKSIVGATVGGAAGAFSRITSTMGKGLAALTWDSEYQSRRRERMAQQPVGVAQGIAKNFKELQGGFYSGVTGIVTKPLEGARTEGVGGFLKGVGRGVVGLVVRPAAGVVDFASGSFGVVRSVTDNQEEISTRVRLPRHIREDGVVRPYIQHDAEGKMLLRELGADRTGTYVTHVMVSVKEKSVLLITDERIMLAHLTDIFSTWTVDWSYELDELSGVPSQIEGEKSAVQLILKAAASSGLGLFKRSRGNRRVVIKLRDEETAHYVVHKIQEALRKQEINSEVSAFMRIVDG